MGGVALGLIAQQLTESQQRAGGNGHRQFRVFHVEPAGRCGRGDIPLATRRQASVRGDQFQPVGEHDTALLRAPAKHSAGQPEAAREGLRGIFGRVCDGVQQRPVSVEHLVDRRLKQFFLAVEVVVERPDADIGGVADVLHRDVDLAGGDESLCGFDQGGSGALLSTFLTVGRPVGIVHAASPRPAPNLAFALTPQY
ncbi:hypothetical protein NIIDMKKI_26980 [Mycobacterium kansasii]|uniref:Uncharacterized protein n=1 Tax=Mycobacterium kansasii TaxID=1768 RepID=A0A7G1IC92_MYCKA|nr:hypothetical protein NIIDMKKI_26980 [Mycobacterium kansasii]